MTEDLYYRFDDKRVSSGGYDYWGEYVHDSFHTEVRLTKFPVVKRTPKGAWIMDCGLKCFVNDAWRKARAHSTIEKAKHSFIKRKERQASIYKARAKTAREAIELVKDDKPGLHLRGGLSL